MRFRDALSQVLAPVVPQRPVADEHVEGSRPTVITPLNFYDFYSGLRSKDAMFSLSYLACELAKARPISTLPIKVYTKTDRSRTPAVDPVGFQLNNMLTGRWNPTIRSADAIRWVMMTKDTLGSAYVRVEWGMFQNRMCPVAMWPLTGHIAKLWDDEQRVLKYQYDGDQFTKPGILLDREVIEFRSQLPSTDGTSRSLAEAAAVTVGLSIELENFYERLLSNGTHMPIWFETDANLSPRDREEFAQSLSDSRGVLNAGIARVFDKGMRLKQNTATITDLGVVEEQRWVLQQLCRITGVPPNEVYEQTQTSYSGNVEQTAVQFASKTLVPECHDLEDAFNGVIRSAGVYEDYVKFDMNGLLRGLYESRMKGYQIGVFTGFFTRNEPREWEELDPLPGLDAPLMPVNYYTVDEDGDPVPPPTMDGSQAGAPGEAGNAPSDPKKAAQALLEGMRKRIRERAADTGDTPRTREFARKVLSDWASYCVVIGEPFDVEAEIEELMR